MQLIKPDLHPVNITVFETETLTEAVKKADAALRESGIQGALWYRKGNDFYEDDPFALRRAFFTVTNPHKDFKQQAIPVAVEACRENDALAVKFYHKTAQNTDPVPLLCKRRMQDLEELSLIFNRVKLEARYEKQNKISPHYDYWRRKRYQVNDDLPFGGRDIRILALRTGAGTGMYDCKRVATERGIVTNELVKLRLPEPWYAPANTYLFLASDVWGKGKSLLHTPPAFYAPNPADARIVDTYDCYSRPVSP